MTKPDINVEIAVIVLSCDKYSDLWGPFFTLFDKHWPTCPFPTYLLANQKRMEHTKYITLLSGEDKDWSTSFKKQLQQVNESYVLLFFDDALISKDVASESVAKIQNIISAYKPDYFRFRPYPKPKIWLEENVGRFAIDEPYRTALYAAWKKDVLLDLLVEGESAWQFEMQSVPRSEKYKEFLGTDYAFFSPVHGVEKGLWLRPAVRFLRQNNIPIDLGYRRQMDRFEALQSQIKWIRGKLYIITPEFVQKKLISLSGFIRQNIWSNW